MWLTLSYTSTDAVRTLFFPSKNLINESELSSGDTLHNEIDVCPRRERYVDAQGKHVKDAEHRLEHKRF